ncbi:hypothetical protein [uncultured Eudoraea sp.]|uniref:hypothetical protein n=1 Tax=uncultured Eudoraea sp. TaxID=1035614 RepID=UPI00262F8050|nr:hypothetical protein [uncultured Eudoraea sp.]
MSTKNITHTTHASNAVYGLGFIGAAVYYIQMASGFWSVIVGLIKALLWPAFIIYEVLRHLEL